MAYAFDPELQPWVAMMPTLDISDISGARAELRTLAAAAPAYEPAQPLDIEDRLIPGSSGAPDVPVRVYTPRQRTAPLPGLLFIHGGGFVVGDIDSEDVRAQEIAASAGVVVVSVDYRLAPEHPFPAGLDDCYAALVWMEKSSAEIGVDPQRLGVGGGSAGGGLAAATALMARDRGGPRLCMQYLGIPELDDRLETHSMTVYTDTPVWNRPNAILSWKYYLAGAEPTQYAAPARARELSGLPPTYVDVCEFDSLRDEGIGYAQRLVQAGVPVELHLYPGTFHGSSLVADAAVSRRMSADSIDGIQRLLHGQQGSEGERR
jgi:acetyl esterase/lipase